MRAIIKDSELLAGRALGETYLRENRTDAYVCVPPALIVTAPDGKAFTLGFKYRQGRDLEFNVLVDDRDSGEFASRIEMAGGRVRIFGGDGWRTWNGRSFI